MNGIYFILMIKTYDRNYADDILAKQVNELRSLDENKPEYIWEK